MAHHGNLIMNHPNIGNILMSIELQEIKAMNDESFCY